MAFDLLCNISPASKQWKIRVRVARMWDYCGGRDDQPPLHVDFVLVDEKGNAMYAEIPGADVNKFRPIIQEFKIYEFSKFLVVPSKPAFKPFANKYMIRFTPWTNVNEVSDVDSGFPAHVFNLVPFLDLSLRVGMQEYFTDVIGMVVGVSKLAYVRMASNPSETPKRVIALKDLLNCEVKLVLWGQRALDFDADAIHDVGQNHAVVGIFVDEETLSGGSACRWYLNEDIPEINDFFDSLTDDAPKVQWISAGVESFGTSRRPARLEQKTVAELKNIDPWEAEATIKEYRMCLIGTNGTDSAEFVLFGRVAQQVVGRTVMSLVRFEPRSDNLPREIAAVVSQKFTFSVFVTEKSLMQRNISFQVNSIETFFGRQGAIPQVKERPLFIVPSSISSTVAIPSMAKHKECSDRDFTPPGSSNTSADIVREMHSEGKKRRSIIRLPLGASKKLTFEAATPKENITHASPASNNAVAEDETPVDQHSPIVSDHGIIPEASGVTTDLKTQHASLVSNDGKKKSVVSSTTIHKTRPSTNCIGNTGD